MSEPIRIRIPKQGHTAHIADNDEHDIHKLSQHQPSSSAKRTKRRLVTSDSEDDIPSSDLNALSNAHDLSSPNAPPRLKRARTSTVTNSSTTNVIASTKANLHAPTAAGDTAYHAMMNMSPLTEPDVDAMDLDVDILDSEDEPVTQSLPPPLRSAAHKARAAAVAALRSPEDTRFLAAHDDDDDDVNDNGDDGADNDYAGDSHAPPKFKQKKERAGSYRAHAGEARKKRHVVYSSDEEADADLDVVVDDDDEVFDLGRALGDDDGEDDAFDLDEHEPRKRGAARGRRGAAGGKGLGKGKMVLGIGKDKGRKERKEEREILARDKRNFAAPQAALAISSASVAASTTADSGRDRDSGGADALFDNPAAGASAAADADAADGPARQESGAASVATSTPTPTSTQPKKKLPTIRKTKAANAGGSSAGSTPSRPGTAAQAAGSSGAAAAPPPGGGDELAKLTAPSAAARKPAAFAGISDVDLSNKDIYAELFRGGGGKSSSAGLSRQEKERQRRAELDRMRDEARAKRVADATKPFDLQEQADKIARYEERFKREQSFVLYPNFLAAKFRSEWDNARTRRREQQPEAQDARAA
ncbi:hypothetical protein CONPUDRAFT_150023 [Coniophora puteana RWD-64-598 SS2]|uniref:Uncharacterized protein n=1 Tax=Coniophora puteana (strain RWD-64-598) TaxID=741705 RepID=A0A5M3N1A9_CONPW|nr:uncharacterized protein CONPUDRAFT_150023 [Coniophora puteana RWD-64-598 SS2]EIW85190.1 hypothetical protein CONPUDRAFT_150023 [Coniophora puteana RWD-64-598 SS2]